MTALISSTPSMPPHRRPRPPAGPRLAGVALAVALLLSACGGGGTVPGEGVSLRPLSADFSSRKAVAYSPFRSNNRDTETITAAMVKQDLDLLLAGQFRLIRLFDSSDAVAKLVLNVIRDNGMDIKVMLGAYVQSGDSSFNEAELARAVALANTYADIVTAVSVGNETMVNWSFNKLTPAQMAGYIKTVRDAIRQPVTTDDNWAFFAQAASESTDPKGVLAAIDFVSMHTYPLLDTVPPAIPNWNWEQQAVAAGPQRATAMMDAALASAKSEYQQVRAQLDRLGHTTMPIVIGETGWKAEASGGEYNRAHPVNQKMYFDRLSAWRQGSSAPTAIIYFEAFDEPWKGRDDKWGLFNVNRQVRCMVRDLYPAVTPEAGSCAADDAVYAPTVVQSTITQAQYVVYADGISGDVARAGGLSWYGFGGDGGNGNSETAYSGEISTGADAPYREIAPNPASYGWGHFAISQTASGGREVADLSQFEASGRLNFRIRSTYPGRLEVGFLTGTGSSAYDVYLPISNSNTDGYGYINDGQWHTVSVPISALKAAGAPSYGNNANQARFDLTQVSSPFTLADRYAYTGNSAARGNTSKVQIDEVHWSK